MNMTMRARQRGPDTTANTPKMCKVGPNSKAIGEKGARHRKLIRFHTTLTGTDRLPNGMRSRTTSRGQTFLVGHTRILEWMEADTLMMACTLTSMTKGVDKALGLGTLNRDTRWGENIDIG